MRTLIWVLLVLAACKQAPKEVDGPSLLLNTELATKLDAFGRQESKENLEACLNTLRISTLFVGVKPGESKAAITADKEGAHVIYAFLEPEAASLWWRGVDGVASQAAAATSILDVAIFDKADIVIIDPQLPDRSLVIPRDNFMPIARAWKTRAASLDAQ